MFERVRTPFALDGMRTPWNAERTAMAIPAILQARAVYGRP